LRLPHPEPEPDLRRLCRPGHADDATDQGAPGLPALTRAGKRESGGSPAAVRAHPL